MRIKEVQNRLYDIMIIFDNICRKNHISYWLHGGTAIGAVREHDFIPWDDDVDILILAEDYPKLKSTMKKELPQYLHFIEPIDFSPFFYDYIPKIIDDRFLLRTENNETLALKNYNNHVCLDIFLLSYCPQSKLQQKLWLLEYNIIYGMAMGYRYSIDYRKYSFIHKCEVAFLRALGKIISGKTPERLFKLWESFVYSCAVSKTQTRMISNTTPNCYWHPMPDEWFKATVLKQFRDVNLPVEKDYDLILTQAYGDYMIPTRDSQKYMTHLDSNDYTL